MNSSCRYLTSVPVDFFFFPVSMVKNPHARTGDSSSIPGLGRSLEKEVATHFSILVWEIPWMEEPGRLATVHGDENKPDMT